MTATNMPNDSGSYNLIIGKQMMKQLKINIDLDKDTIKWKDISVSIVNHGHWNAHQIHAFIHLHLTQKVNNALATSINKAKSSPTGSNKDTLSLGERGKSLASQEVHMMMTLKCEEYKAANLVSNISGLTHLNGEQQNKLLETLSRYQDMFQGWWGN